MTLDVTRLAVSSIPHSAGSTNTDFAERRTDAAKVSINTFVQSTTATLSGVIATAGDRAVVALTSRRRPIVVAPNWRNHHGDEVES